MSSLVAAVAPKRNAHRHCLYFFISSGNICRNLSPVAWANFYQVPTLHSFEFCLTKNHKQTSSMGLWNYARLAVQVYTFSIGDSRPYFEASLWVVARISTPSLVRLICMYDYPHMPSCSTTAPENDLCCGRVLIGLAPRCVRAPVCARTSAQMFAYVYVSMLTAWAVSEALSAARHMWLSTSLSGSFLCS